MTADENPFEVGLGVRVDFEKGDFIGRDALLRISEAGPKRTMSGAFMDGLPFQKNNEHRWPVFSGGTKVGEVTCAVHSPRLDRNIGFALLETAHADPAALFTVETPEGARNLALTTIPFLDPEKKIPRSPLR